MGQECLCYSDMDSNFKLKSSKLVATKAYEASKQKALPESKSSTSDNEWLKKENVFLKVSRIQKDSEKRKFQEGQ